MRLTIAPATPVVDRSRSGSRGFTQCGRHRRRRWEAPDDKTPSLARLGLPHRHGVFRCARSRGSGRYERSGRRRRVGRRQLRPVDAPAAVSSVAETATEIATGYEHSCAIQAGGGEVVCCGDDSFGSATPPDGVARIPGTAIEIAFLASRSPNSIHS